MPSSDSRQRIWTIGHSTRSIEDFAALLAQHSIAVLADVRLLPGSKRYPHFNSDALARSLGEHGIRYEHFRELGGRRKPRPDSANTAWRNDAFRGYADYMEGNDFAAGVERLVGLAASKGATAIMCAEAVWWRCHRGLVSDYLKARGVEVMHIVGANKVEPHPWTSAATIVGGHLSYAATGSAEPPLPGL
ncbi:MAG TPA: DUF488 domain-containing protein [Chthoniobacterales bacterium]|nr:DUF488 domain-containing protein [Chthoniobacterales bacterium]